MNVPLTEVEKFHFSLLHVLANRGIQFDETFVNSLEEMSLEKLTEVLVICFGNEAHKILEDTVVLNRK